MNEKVSLIDDEENIERDLLEHALAGSVKVLLDIQALSEPEVFERANRVHGWMKQVVASLGMDHPWELGMAALLAPIGRVTLPPAILAKDASGIAVSEEEAELIARVPEASKALLSNLPRMGYISDIALFQDKGYDGTGIPAETPGGEEIPIGARLLKILNALAIVSTDTQPTVEVFDRAFTKSHLFDEALLTKVKKLLTIDYVDRSDMNTTDEGDTNTIDAGDTDTIEDEDDENDEEEVVPMTLTLARLMPDDILNQDIVVNEILLLKEGQTLTENSIERLLLLAELHEYEEQIDISRSLSSLTPLQRKALEKEKASA